MAATHFLNENRTNNSFPANPGATRTQYTPGELVAFLRELVNVGCTPTHGPDFLDLVNYRPEPYSAPAPFSTSAADAYTSLTEYTIRAGKTRTAWDGHIRDAGKIVLSVMQAEADEHITAMRPAFDEAARAIARARKLGLTEESTEADLTQHSTIDQIIAWRAAQDAAKTLDQIASARIGLSRWTGIPPVRNNAENPSMHTDYTAAFVRGVDPTRANPTIISGQQAAHRWLHLQNIEGTALHLSSLEEMQAAVVDYADATPRTPDPKARAGA